MAKYKATFPIGERYIWDTSYIALRVWNQMKPCCLAVMSANFYCVEKPEIFSGLPIGAKSKASKSRKKKEQKKKREKKRIAASESRRTRTCIIFRSLGGETIDDNYETEVCGIPQLETVDLETLSQFKPRTDLACLRDLLNAKCFIGKAHNVVCDFCAWAIVSIYHMLTF